MFCLIMLFALCFASLNQAQSSSDGFIRAEGVKFTLNGAPYYANGFNSYWLTTLASDPNQRSKVTEAFAQARQYGLTLARTMAFSVGEGASSLQPNPGQYNENVFQALDFVVSEAKQHGIRLLMTLIDNYDTPGGRPQHVKWARSKGANVSSDDDFFRNDVCKELYKNNAKTILTRVNTITEVAYKDDPTIMAWELMNEPRCPTDLSGKTITDWVTDMASYLKSIDSNHLLDVGLEGFYGPSTPERLDADRPFFQVGTDYIANNKVQGIDFATVHTYPDEWYSDSTDEVQLKFLQEWMTNHTQDAQNILKMPVLYAEFGVSSKKAGFSVAKRDEVFTSVYTAIDSSASNNGGAAAGSLFWQLLAPDMSNYGDGYAIVLSESRSTAKIIRQQSQKIQPKQYRKLRNMENLKKKKKETGLP
uniref:mannan endo-1,4-beta-mannosidase n=1 Tax=Kalanchoe fedtschenkoi TaxID=63787 RepID=A0A7N0UGL3_KALFE